MYTLYMYMNSILKQRSPVRHQSVSEFLAMSNFLFDNELLIPSILSQYILCRETV